MEWHIQQGQGAFLLYRKSGVNILNNQAGETRILVKQGNTVRFVEAKEVIYIESIGRKAALHLENETIEYYATLNSLAEKLQPDFFRIHRAYLINLQYVKSYNKREVHMANGDSVLISKYRLPAFQKLMEV